MIDIPKLDKLIIYNGSWALWPDKQESFAKNCNYVTSYFYENHAMLKSNIIFLAFNRSGSKNPVIKSRNDFCNFHSLNHNGDKRLEKNIMHLDNLKAAYMTDLNNEIVCSKPKGITIEHHNFNIFINQLEILNPDEKQFYIICFGMATFTNLLKFLPNSTKPKEIDPKMLLVTKKFKDNILKIYKMYHYSCPDHGHMKEREDVLKIQFKYINDHLFDI